MLVYSEFWHCLALQPLFVQGALLVPRSAPESGRTPRHSRPRPRGSLNASWKFGKMADNSWSSISGETPQAIQLSTHPQTIHTQHKITEIAASYRVSWQHNITPPDLTSLTAPHLKSQDDTAHHNTYATAHGHARAHPEKGTALPD